MPITEEQWEVIKACGAVAAAAVSLGIAIVWLVDKLNLLPERVL